MERKTTRSELHLPPELGDEIDVWRWRQKDIPTRAEAVRRLIVRSLEADKPPATGGFASGKRQGSKVNWVSDRPNWTLETSGILRPAVETYLRGDDMTREQVAAVQDYLRQWITAPAWYGPEADALRQSVDGLVTAAAISQWLDLAAAASNIDPL